MAIKRNISVLNPGIIADIDIVYGSDLIPIEFYITDYVLPDNAIATLYCTTSDKQLLKSVGKHANNVISFSPANNFFAVGKNSLQIRITSDEKNLYTFELGVSCKPRMATDDAQEVESQPTLIDQLLTQVGNVSGELEKQQGELKTAEENIRKTKTQDTKENVTTFKSSDALDSKEIPIEWTDVDVLESGEKHGSILAKISAMFKNVRFLKKKVDELNSDLTSLKTRVSYIDCSGGVDGYRINIPCNVNFENTYFAAVSINDYIPSGYEIDRNNPMIQATINATNVPVILKCVSYYHNTAIQFELNENYTGEIVFAVGLRLIKR